MPGWRERRWGSARQVSEAVPSALQPTDPLPPKPVVQLTATLQLPTGLTLDFPIQIDSGSNADFVGVQFVKQHRIALLPATLPLNVVTVDGRKLLGGQVVQQTPPMLLKIGNHREVISFNVTQLSDTPIVLGMSWLDRHSPSLAWYQRQLTLARPTAHNIASRSARTRRTRRKGNSCI
ncbi:Hypothetical predicted protein [Podarcis lilfordi]|uniref:Retropepsins domain-containing protein n=1 Tax=Podarcis lilfordi TaxID=74358 RepID=A0AA35KIH9_9SAUR|nr:Hypothetical predicted protein [Podarcis lilfordi]